MEEGRQRLVQRRGWDRASSHYERYWRRQLQPALDLLLETAALQPGEDVIDVACGTGLATLPAATLVGPAGRVVATDIAPKMVDGLRETVERRGLGNVEVRACGAEALDVDGRFDVALCSLGLMYLPTPSAAIAELHRVLRDDGRTVLSVWGERRNCGWADLFPIVDARVSSDVCPLFFGLGAPGALCRQLESAGFVDVDEVRIGVELDYLDDDEALGAAFLGGPVALAYAHFDAATRRSANDDYLTSLAAWAHDGGYRVPGEFVIASGRRGPHCSTTAETTHEKQ